MAEVRVYELAKEFGVESKVVMDQLREMGEFARGASSKVDAPVVRRLREVFAAKAAVQDREQERSRLAEHWLPPVPPSPASRPAATRSSVPGAPRPGGHSGPRPGQRSGASPFGAKIDGTTKPNDNAIEGTAAKVNRDEVLPDIGSDSGSRASGDWVSRQSGASSREAPIGPGSVHELLRSWDALKKAVPAGEKPVPFLASRTRLKATAISQLQRTRNQCAHPGEDGWPGSYDIDMATATARELLRRLKDF